jgi:hypothetical protein
MGTVEAIVEILRVFKPLIWAMAILWVGKSVLEVYDVRFNPALPQGTVRVLPAYNRALPVGDPHALALIRARGR